VKPDAHGRGGRRPDAHGHGGQAAGEHAQPVRDQTVVRVAREGGQLAQHEEQVLHARQVAGLHGRRARVQQLLRPPHVGVRPRAAHLVALLGATALVTLAGRFVVQWGLWY
jgi:hypothetical protein